MTGFRTTVSATTGDNWHNCAPTTARNGNTWYTFQINAGYGIILYTVQITARHGSVFDVFRLPQTCPMWTSQKNLVSDNCRSSKNRSYLGCLLTNLSKLANLLISSLNSFLSHRSIRPSSLITLSRPSLTSHLKIANTSYFHSHD